MSVADRMEQSCPICGSDTIWDCKCSDMDEHQSPGLNNWTALEEATVSASTNVNINTSVEVEEKELLQSDSDA